MVWKAVLEHGFAKSFKKLKKDKKTREILKRGMDEILIDPMHNSSTYQKLMTRYRQFGKLRVIYQPCWYCRKIGVDKDIRCVDCETHDDNTVKFLDFDFRKKVYDR